MYSSIAPTLFRTRWPDTGLEDSIASVDADELVDEYRKLRESAPRRSEQYFSRRRNGTTVERSPDTPGIQWEPRYAIALWNLDRRWPRRGGRWHRFIDYQVPLKDIQANRKIGKIDLVGITDQGRFLVVELKCPRSDRGQSPAHALMEGLRYAAIVEANLHTVTSEARKRFDCKTDAEAPPIVQILGPVSWWRDWLDPGLKKRAAGDWDRAFTDLASTIEERIGVTVECMATDTNIAEAVDGLSRRMPSISPSPTLYAVDLDRNPPGFERLS